MDYKEFELVDSVINTMLPYVAVKYLLNYGYTFNKRKKRSKDILNKNGNFICLLSPCKNIRVEYRFLSEESYIKIMFYLI